VFEGASSMLEDALADPNTDFCFLGGVYLDFKLFMTKA